MNKNVVLVDILLVLKVLKSMKAFFLDMIFVDFFFPLLHVSKSLSQFYPLKAAQILYMCCGIAFYHIVIQSKCAILQIYNICADFW